MSKSALLRIGKSKTTARKIATQVSLSDLGAAIKNLQSAERLLAKQTAAKESTKKAQQIKKAMSMLDRMGLKPEDLDKAKKPKQKASKTTGVKRKVAAKYRITFKGVTTEWSGRGRMPIVFREAIVKNGTIEKHLIK